VHTLLRRIRVQERRVAAVCALRNHHRSTLVTARWRAQIRAAWWPSERGNRGKNERGSRVSYRRINASKGAGNRWDLNTAVIDARGVSTRDFWTGEEDDDLARHVGPVCQRGIRAKRVPLRDCLAGPWAWSSSRPKWLPEALFSFLFYFLLFFFCFTFPFLFFFFLISFIWNNFKSKSGSNKLKKMK
jgi:hypothetical protein